jgi:hypothetical protein
VNDVYMEGICTIAHTTIRASCNTLIKPVTTDPSRWALSCPPTNNAAHATSKTPQARDYAVPARAPQPRGFCKMRCPVGSHSGRRTDLHHLTHENGHVAHRLPAKSLQKMTNGPGVESLVADLNVISCWFSEAEARLYAVCAGAQRTTTITDVDGWLGSC